MGILYLRYSWFFIYVLTNTIVIKIIGGVFFIGSISSYHLTYLFSVISVYYLMICHYFFLFDDDTCVDPLGVLVLRVTFFDLGGFSLTRQGKYASSLCSSSLDMSVFFIKI